MPSSLGPAEILVILVVGLIVLGPQRLPEAGRQVGRAIAEIRRWSRDVQAEVKGAFDDEALRPTFDTSATPRPETPPAGPAVPAPPEGDDAGAPEVVGGATEPGPDAGGAASPAPGGERPA